jgi:phage-related protein
MADIMNWKITFYNQKVLKQIRSFPVGIQTNLTYILELIAELGPNLGKPHTAPLGKGLFEIRAKGKGGISRSFFCTMHEHEVVILHSIIKKSQKAPKKEVALAIKRMKEIKNE